MFRIGSTFYLNSFIRQINFAAFVGFYLTTNTYWTKHWLIYTIKNVKPGALYARALARE